MDRELGAGPVRSCGRVTPSRPARRCRRQCRVAVGVGKARPGAARSPAATTPPAGGSDHAVVRIHEPVQLLLERVDVGRHTQSAQGADLAVLHVDLMPLPELALDGAGVEPVDGEEADRSHLVGIQGRVQSEAIDGCAGTLDPVPREVLAPEADRTGPDLDPNGGQRWVVYDEAWRLVSHPALLRADRRELAARPAYGIANMPIFHKLSDRDNVGDQGSAMRALASSLLANAETRGVYRQESDQLGSTAAALGLTGTEQQLLPTLGTGQGLWRIKHRSFVVQHQLHPAELELFDITDGCSVAG
jgi:hypothetical protein